MTFIGIDPGKSGAMATITEENDGSVSSTSAVLFSESAYRDALDAVGGNAFAVVENVHSMPKQGVSSSFAFGQNFGWIIGLLYARAIPTELVNPQKWKRMFSCTADKNTSIIVAERLFPRQSLYATERCRKPHDGIAEALLMAEYGRRIHGRMSNGFSIPY